MTQGSVGITLTDRDIQLVELAVVDGDGAAAVDFLRRVVKPQVDAARKAGCRPVFEWRTPDSVPSPPITSPKRSTA
jgi:hypothetical protein